MLFNSWVFLLFFLLVYPAYRFLNHQWQNRLLLLASWVFYGWWDWTLLGLLVGTTVVDWGVGRLLEDPARPHRGRILALSVVANLGVLATFKYFGFFVSQLNDLAALAGLGMLLPVLKIALPVGISFYTFQSMSYTIDVYRGHTKALRSFWDFALFVSYFPQLVAGPIERSGALLPQLQAPRTVTSAQMDSGSWFMLWGFAKKILIADNLATIVEEVFDAPRSAGGLNALVAAYAFTFQIYCDFSGYSDIARGLSRWMGIELMENFRRPFFAESPRDLWRRWHISLSQWLRDYLYIPLGGNRTGHAQRNLMVTMLLGGLWHGANWTYVVWGGLHGLALAVQHRLGWEPKSRNAKVLGVVLTFHLTVVAFVFFRASSLGGALNFLGSIGQWSMEAEAVIRLKQLLLLILPLMAVEAVLEWRPQWLVQLPRPLQAIGAGLLFWLTLVLGASFGQKFIYFQF